MREPSRAEAGAIRRRLLSWFADNDRHFPWRAADAPLYQQVIAELLLQRTRADAVARSLPGILALAPSWEVLASVDEAVLGDTLKPLGLWKRRSASMRRLALAVNEAGGALPRKVEELAQLPGLGQYMANVIHVVHGKGRAAYVDVNMARVLERLFGPRRLSDIRYDLDLQSIARRIVNSPRCLQVNWAIMDLAALVCVPRVPRCDLCPLFRHCDYYWDEVQGAPRA